MYYRRKLLLGLLEAFDDSLQNTDFEKVLFNVCKISGKNHDDFFPYHFGPFSFVSYYDKRRLAELRLLKEGDDFRLNTRHSYFRELEFRDQRAILALKASGVLGRRLLRKTYRENPQFASRSEILCRLFSPDEVARLQAGHNTCKVATVFTIGYEGHSLDSFLYELIAQNVGAVVDVRHNPQSMKYGFSKRSLGSYVGKAGMSYFHIPELGVPSSMRRGLGTPASYRRLFKRYEAELLPGQSEARLRLLSLIREYPRIALLCFEAEHQFCHRHTLANFLQKKDGLKTPVQHL